MTDRDIIQGLIDRDNTVTEQFFFVKCRPLFHSIIHFVFPYEVDYDEFVNELYIYLMEDNGRKLRNFQYRSSVYQWLKVLAIRFFINRFNALTGKALKEGGVKTIIDLREMDKSDRLPQLCQYHGLEYFHYPLDNHARTIVQMAELFPLFCEHIDKGDFYIACAMELHHTDIALCNYWVFYAADKGIAPPPIRGYRQEEGHDTNKIMRILNAFYKYKSETEGEPPMSIEVFKERKKIINVLSKS